MPVSEGVVGSCAAVDVMHEVCRFDPDAALAAATPPPASWYLAPAFADLEREAVFRRYPQVVGTLDQVPGPGSYFCGSFLGVPYLVVRDADGLLGAFYNVCAHHGTRVADGCGTAEQFQCPYHGWRYGLDGRLRAAPLAGAVADVRRRAPGLKPLPLAVHGPFILLGFGDAPPAWSPAVDAELAALRLEGLQPVATRRYTVACNWKVFVDNYLDGGYHVAHMHPALADGLELAAYRSRLGADFVAQTCPARGQSPRLGADAVYLWLYPNFMINRYGPWMDTNLVLPLGPDRCEVVFRYYHDGTPTPAETAEALAASDLVQQEDTTVVERVQEGLGSGAYSGLYAPRFEAPMFLFHQLLHRDFTAARGAT